MRKQIFIAIMACFITISAAAQWTRVNSLPARAFNNIVAYGDTIYAVTDSSLFYRSTDAGTSWTTHTVSANPIIINAFALLNNKIYIGTTVHGIFYSDNNGQSWSNMGSSPLSVTGITKKGNDLFAATFGYGVYKLNQGNNTWEAHNNALPPNAVNVNAIFTTPNSLLIAAGINGSFFRYNSINNNWNETYYDSLLPVGFMINQLAGFANTLLAANASHILRSDDDGYNWVKDTTGLRPGYSRSVYFGENSVYSLSNVIAGGPGAWIQYRNKTAPAGSNWRINEDFISGVTGYDMIEFNNKIFVATTGGLFAKDLNTTNVNHFSETETTIFPNPYNGKSLTISAKTQFTQLHLLNAQGQIVHNQAINEMEFTLQTNLPKGIYFIVLQNDNGLKTVKKIAVN